MQYYVLHIGLKDVTANTWQIISLFICTYVKYSDGEGTVVIFVGVNWLAINIFTYVLC